MSLAQFERTEIYQQAFRPIGARYQLAAALATPGPVPAGVGFTRRRRDFGDREKDLLDLLRPHLAAARESVRTRTTAEERLAALERGLEAQGRGVVALRGDRFEALSPKSEQMLRRWFPDGVPEIVDAQAIVLEDEGVRLTVCRAGGDPPLLLLNETRLAPDPARARELGLTARESEVLALAATGLSDVRIAEQLVVSVRTVEKHLEHAYRKLGVSGRLTAVAKALEQKVEIGGRADEDGERQGGSLVVSAKFDARTNTTRIGTEGPGGESTVVQPGLVLVALVTDAGALTIQR